MYCKTKNACQLPFCRPTPSTHIFTFLHDHIDVKRKRHNGNILIDGQGHIIHIDFGFMLSNSPGSLGFEMAPFKLTQEYIDILGGTLSELFEEFRNLMKDTFLALRKHHERIITLVEIMERGTH